MILVDKIFSEFCLGKVGGKMELFAGEYDVIVIGGGHAG